ncbi:hypothetical protein TgHK011_009747 [Trichoderma gracile]|nr:hypothetical protein TgHK011_009747 [Trichoderma gracile]
MSPREHVRLPLLGNDGALFVVLAREAGPEAAAPGVVVVHNADDDDDDNDDDDHRVQVLEAEDAAHFDELGGASPVPEGDDEVDSLFGDNEAGSRESVIRRAIAQLHLDETEEVLQLPGLSDGSSSLGDEDEDEDEDEDDESEDEDDESGVDEDEDDESGVDEDSDEEEEEIQDYLLIYTTTEAMAEDMELPGWMEAVMEYIWEGDDFPPLQRQQNM